MFPHKSKLFLPNCFEDIKEFFIYSYVKIQPTIVVPLTLLDHDLNKFLFDTTQDSAFLTKVFW